MKIHLHFSSNSHLMLKMSVRISAVIFSSKKVWLRQAMSTLPILNMFIKHWKLCSWKVNIEIFTHKMWNMTWPQIQEECFEHPKKIWEKSERTREEVCITWNCADKAKIINRFSIDPFIETFQNRIVRSASIVSKNLGRAVSKQEIWCPFIFHKMWHVVERSACSYRYWIISFGEDTWSNKLWNISWFGISSLFKNIKNSSKMHSNWRRYW